MQRIHLTEFPTVTMFWVVTGWATRPEVKNFNVNRIAIHAATRLDEVWLDQ